MQENKNEQNGSNAPLDLELKLNVHFRLSHTTQWHLSNCSAKSQTGSPKSQQENKQILILHSVSCNLRFEKYGKDSKKHP